MRQKQSGSGAIEVLLILVIVGIIGFVGWYVWQSKKTTDKTHTTSNSSAQQSTKKYTDSAKVYEVMYPAAWTVNYPSAGTDEGPAPDWTKKSRRVDLTPPNAPESNSVSIQADSTPALAELIRKHWSDNGHKPQPMKINGYDAEYVQVKFQGDAENYTDDQYLITHKNASVYLTFREKYYHQFPAADWDASSEVSDFNALVHSLKFLQ